MPPTKIPDSILKTFECAECGHYLSNSPIGTRPDGTTVCNNCYDESVTRCHLFEALASLHTFPCNYRAQGCCEYLPFNNTTNHESNCAYQVYICPVNLQAHCSWAGTVSQIYTHYKKHHPELRVQNPCFTINLSKEYECSYLVSIQHVNIILNARHCANRRSLCLNAVYLGDVNNAASIKYSIKLSNDNNSGRNMELEERSTLPLTELYKPDLNNTYQIDVVDLIGFLQNPELIHCQWNFKLPDNVKQIVPMKPKGKNRICPSCYFSMVPPIYRCNIGHISCNDCKGYDNYCKMCHECDSEFSRAVDLEDKAIDSQYYCRWKNCFRCFDCFSIKQHEQECSKRIYECPICLKHIGRFDNVFKHFNSKHVNITFIFTRGNSIKLNKKTDICYVFASREIFKVIIVEIELYKWIIDIIYYGTPSLNNWKYEVVGNCNALHYASKYSHNQYRVEHDEYSDRTHKQCHFSITFIKQQPTSMMWIPYSPSCTQTSIDTDY